MHAFSIMNHTPLHFLIASITTLVFAAAALSKDAVKKHLTFALQLLFFLILISGLYMWSLVPLTWAVMVKSAGGVAIMWTMLQLVEDPQRWALWALLVGVAGTGLTLAFFFI